MHADAARRFSEDGHALRIAAEGRDVVLHPLQRELLVEDAVVAGDAGGGLGAERRVREKSERADTVVDRDHHDVARVHELGRVVVVALADLEGAAVDPHHDRTLPSQVALGDGLAVRRVDVQEEAILVVVGRLAERARPLRAAAAERARVARRHPGRVRLGRRPAQRSDRRLGVRDAEELEHARADDAGHGTDRRVGGDGLRVGCARDGERAGGDGDETSERGESAGGHGRILQSVVYRMARGTRSTGVPSLRVRVARSRDRPWASFATRTSGPTCRAGRSGSGSRPRKSRRGAAGTEPRLMAGAA